MARKINSCGHGRFLGLLLLSCAWDGGGRGRKVWEGSCGGVVRGVVLGEEEDDGGGGGFLFRWGRGVFGGRVKRGDEGNERRILRESILGRNGLVSSLIS